MNRSGAYKKVRMAIPKSIHSKPIVLTNVPLIAGPKFKIKMGLRDIIIVKYLQFNNLILAKSFKTITSSSIQFTQIILN
jgi:hypothetical protein